MFEENPLSVLRRMLIAVLCGLKWMFLFWKILFCLKKNSHPGKRKEDWRSELELD